MGVATDCADALYVVVFFNKYLLILILIPVQHVKKVGTAAYL